MLPHLSIHSEAVVAMVAVAGVVNGRIEASQTRKCDVHLRLRRRRRRRNQKDVVMRHDEVGTVDVDEDEVLDETDAEEWRELMMKMTDVNHEAEWESTKHQIETWKMMTDYDHHHYCCCCRLKDLSRPTTRPAVGVDSDFDSDSDSDAGGDDDDDDVMVIVILIFAPC